MQEKFFKEKANNLKHYINKNQDIINNIDNNG